MKKARIVSVSAVKFFGIIALVAIVLVSLGGCAKQRFVPIGQTIQIGDKAYNALLANDRDPWGHDVSSMFLLESSILEEPAPGCGRTYVQQDCQPPQGPCQCHWCRQPQQYQQPQQQYHQPQQYQQHRYYQQQQQAYCAPPAPQTRLVKTRVVNSNNQGGPGWINNTMPNAALGAGISGAGALLRPTRIAGSASSSSAAAAASAASGG